MKQNDDAASSSGSPGFCAELFKYNKVHRLIGNVSCETLVKESATAINNSLKELNAYSIMVDVGAGAGVLAYAWLKSNMNRRVILLEPDRKAGAFLHMYFSKEKRAKVIQKRLEDLKIEDITSFESDTSKVCLATRAFSSSISLEDAYEKSALTLPLYNFQRRDDSFVMLRV